MATPPPSWGITYPGVTPASPYTTAGVPLNAGNAAFYQKGGQLLPGMTVVGGVPQGDASMIQAGDRVVDNPDGSKTVLAKNGLTYAVPAPGGGGEEGGGGGGGGGGGKPPPLALPPVPHPQQIPFPRQAGASSLGAPNQTWDWLLEALAAPGLLSPMLQQLGLYLSQNSTANDQGYSPMISQPNYGGLFGGPNTPAPFAAGPSQPALAQAFQHTPWQGSSPLMNLGSPNLSGSIHPGGMYSGAVPAPQQWGGGNWGAAGGNRGK